MRIGPHDLAQRTLIIAEVGINHGGSDVMAHRLIEAAKEAGADVCKFQMFRTNALIKRRGPQAGFLTAYEFSPRTWQSLAKHCADIGITFMASVFDDASADDYFGMRPAAVKIGSGELHDLPLIRHVAAEHVPMILSTGMATMQEVKAAVEIVKGPLALLHCVSAYPAPQEQANLRAMDALRAFRVPVGYSDHTEGHAVALAAVARGACILEKHLTLDRSLPGPDHQASMEPKDFGVLVAGVRQLETVLGDGVKRVMPSEKKTREYCRNLDSDKFRGRKLCKACREPLEADAHTLTLYCEVCQGVRNHESRQRSDARRGRPVRR